ncbi:MAG: Omp28-related outer membrane protein [Bacteroidetes bacterium]|nr:Omp28-related outer membrane protein [Bacteroidota bacterium]
MRTLLRTAAIAVLFALSTLLPAQTTRTVLLEQMTGTWCQYCPYGADEVDSVLSIFSNARALAYHNQDPMATTETHSVQQHLLVTQYPTGTVDRRLWNTGTSLAIALSRGYWRNAVGTRAQVASNMYIGVAGTYHQDTREINATVTLTMLDDYTGEFYLNVVLSEDSLDYTQKKNINNIVYDISPYYHKRVVRNMITGWMGHQLTTSGFTKNQIVTYPFTFTVPSAYKITNCALTVFVTQKVTLTVNGQPQNKSMNIEQAWQERLLSALTTVPVELISFHASQVGGDVQLRWRTARESNNRGWYIQRRNPGEGWTDIGFVDGYGTTNEQQIYEFTDRMVEMDQVIDYRLRQVDFDGTEDVSDVARVFTMATPTTTRLLPNFPNPFNPSTNIMVELAQDAPMTVEIFDMLGRHVQTLAEGMHSAGAHVFEWNGTDANGSPVQSGIFFARMTTPDHSQTIQMQLAK